jgi:D-alanyl-D-alanine-carboxypeptidase/D-alanyl-D-alanine-endopeptidase
MSIILPPTKEYLESLVDPFLKEQPSGLAFVIGYVGRGFEDIFFKGNLANQFKAPLPLGTDTYFELASISKTFTATLAAALGAQYQTGWKTQLIENYTAAMLSGGLQIGSQFNNIPLSTLLSYTSGLPADNKTVTDLPPDLPVPYSPAGMLGYLNITSLAPSGTGSSYAYSNLGFAIMAQIAPLFSSGLPDFASLMSVIVFDPLGMHHTFFFDDLSIDDFAQGYTYATSPESKVAPGWPGLSAYDGAGGVVSTPNDMMKWLRFNMGRVDTKKTNALNALLPELQTPATPVTTPAGDQLGLGWFLRPGTGNPLQPSGSVWKDGEITGTNTYITFLPWAGTDTPSEAGVFVLTNCNSLTSSGIEVTAAIANDVLITMQGGTPSPDKSNYPRAFGP